MTTVTTSYGAVMPQDGQSCDLLSEFVPSSEIISLWAEKH